MDSATATSSNYCMDMTGLENGCAYNTLQQFPVFWLTDAGTYARSTAASGLSEPAANRLATNVT